MGPDDALSTEWFCETVEMMDDLIDVYDSHHYEGYDAMESLLWINERMKILIEKGIKKPFFITEYGNWSRNDEFYNGLFYAEFVINALNKGISGLSKWTLQSNPYPGESGLNNWGLWEYKNDNWRIRTEYYAYILLTNSLRPGMKIIETKTNSKKILTIAAKNINEKITVIVANRDNYANIEILGDFREDTVFKKYIYSKDTVKNLNKKNIIEPVILRIDKGNKLIDTIEENSFCVYIQE
jgi:hypothetical protein